MANEFSFDPNRATEVKTIYTRKGGQNYDMAYSTKTERFRLSKNASDRLGINKNGFQMIVQDGRPLLVLVPESQAIMFGRRKSKAGEPKGKGDEAANAKLRTYLEESLGAEVMNYSLRKVGAYQGNPVLLIEPYDEAAGSKLEFLGSSVASGASNGAAKQSQPQAATAAKTEAAPVETAPEAPASSDPNDALFEEPVAAGDTAPVEEDPFA